ncbi:hypothetical protein Avbf_18129 [Armadillidium vulgare]|nr:hypothetical protein Avbf_18129 [Armadillidium vulgare]
MSIELKRLLIKRYSSVHSICKSTSDTMQTELQKFGNLAQLSELLNPLWMCFRINATEICVAGCKKLHG